MIFFWKRLLGFRLEEKYVPICQSANVFLKLNVLWKYQSTNQQINKSTNHQIIKSSNHQIIKSTNHFRYPYIYSMAGSLYRSFSAWVNSSR